MNNQTTQERLDIIKLNIKSAERNIQEIKTSLNFDLGKHADKKLYNMLGNAEGASRYWQKHLNEMLAGELQQAA